MDPKRVALESLLADTSFEAPGQRCLLSWEMHRTTVDANEAVKHFDHGDQGRNHRFKKRLYWYSFARGTMGLDARFVYFSLLFVWFCSYFLLLENQVMIILLRPEENMGGEKRTNGCA